MQVNDPILLREFVTSGGLSFAPDLYCRAAIRDGSPCRQALAEHEQTNLVPGIFSFVRTSPSRRFHFSFQRRNQRQCGYIEPQTVMPKKAQVFMSFLRDICAGVR